MFKAVQWVEANVGCMRTCLKKKKSGMVVHSGIREAKTSRSLGEFKVSLAYILSARPIRVT